MMEERLNTDEELCEKLVLQSAQRWHASKGSTLNAAVNAAFRMRTRRRTSVTVREGQAPVSLAEDPDAEDEACVAIGETPGTPPVGSVREVTVEIKGEDEEGSLVRTAAKLLARLHNEKVALGRVSELLSK